jgi:hypothetical protein
MSFVKTIETNGGVGTVGVIPMFLDEKIKELAIKGRIIDPLNPTDAKRAMAVNLVCGEYLGALMLSGANCDRFSLLRTDLQNQYGYGNDLYPKSVQCLSMLNHWTVAPEQPWRDTAPPPTPVPPNKRMKLLFLPKKLPRGRR